MAFETIEEFPDYSVNEEGEVFSHIYNRILKLAKKKHGYLQVGLFKDGKRKWCRVHQLVAKAFIPNPDNKPTIDHIDRDRTNNHINNLRWANKSEQQLNKGYYHIKQDGLHNITLDKRRGTYEIKITIQYKPHYKSFKTLEEAIIYRDKYILENPK